jgi:hypothetical protein
LEKLQRELDMILQDIINDHKISHKEESKDGDLVDALLKIQQENDHSQNPLTDDGIKSVIQVSIYTTKHFNTFIFIFSILV